MRKFSQSFQDHIMGEVTSLCWAWKLTRKDGLVLGFTDHDKALTVQGIDYHPECGFSPSDMESRLGFALDNTALLGGLDSEQLKEADIKGGLFDGAAVEILRVNWKNPEEHALIWGGNIGEIRIRGAQFEAELVGRSAALERATGRVFTRVCGASFGDEHCGVNRFDFPSGTECAHSFEACTNEFQNSANFRGFPYLIGKDDSFAAPRSAEPKDGRSRYKQ